MTECNLRFPALLSLSGFGINIVKPFLSLQSLRGASPARQPPAPWSLPEHPWRTGVMSLMVRIRY